MPQKNPNFIANQNSSCHSQIHRRCRSRKNSALKLARFYSNSVEAKKGDECVLKTIWHKTKKSNFDHDYLDFSKNEFHMKESDDADSGRDEITLNVFYLWKQCFGAKIKLGLKILR